MKNEKRKKGLFICFAQQTAAWAGHPYTFITAVVLIALWAMTGPVFGYSDTWQLIVNTSTTIITFLMVFLIQNTQNRDSKAVQLKLDELIRAVDGAHTVLLDYEELSDEELEKIHQKYEAIAAIARKRLRSGKSDTNIPEIILEQDLELDKKD